MKYMAEDGKVFDTEEACQNYETTNLGNYEAIDEAMSILIQEWGKYIPLKKKMKLKSTIVQILTQ